MIVYLAALQDIPESLYEAARIDGANSMQCFRGITLPMLTPSTFFRGHDAYHQFLQSI